METYKVICKKVIIGISFPLSPVLNYYMSTKSICNFSNHHLPQGESNNFNEKQLSSHLILLHVQDNLTSFSKNSTVQSWRAANDDNNIHIRVNEVHFLLIQRNNYNHYWSHQPLWFPSHYFTWKRVLQKEYRKEASEGDQPPTQQGRDQLAQEPPDKKSINLL